MPAKIPPLFVIILLMMSCLFFNSEGELIYEKGPYSIRKKNLISYYNASPDLFVKTKEREVRINLNGFGKRLIPQEKITQVEINEITKDSLQIVFHTTDTSVSYQTEVINLNVTHAVDSIQQRK